MTDEQTQHAGSKPTDSAHAAPSAAGAGQVDFAVKPADQCPGGDTPNSGTTGCDGGKGDKGL